MKKRGLLKIGLVLLSTMCFSLLLVTSVFADTKNYNGLTTVIYNNVINDSSGSGWNAGYADSTSPSLLKL
jgi:hypothetical protein